MHQALNITAGNSVFGGSLDQFLAKKPAFATIKSELEQFFNLSRQVFFEPNSTQSAVEQSVGSEPLQWLAHFSQRCRDCERGLVPDQQSSTTLSTHTLLNNNKVKK